MYLIKIESLQKHHRHDEGKEQNAAEHHQSSGGLEWVMSVMHKQREQGVFLLQKGKVIGRHRAVRAGISVHSSRQKKADGRVFVIL